MPLENCSVCKGVVPINYQAKSTSCKCVFHHNCLNFGLLAPTKLTPTSCNTEYCFSRYWLVTQEEMDDHKADLTKLENELSVSLENLDPLKVQLRQSKDIVERMVELINQLNPNAYTSIKQQRLGHNLKKVANSSNKYQTLQEINVAQQKNLLSPLDECVNNLKRSNNEQMPVEETSLYCKCNFEFRWLHFGLLSTKKITPKCSATYCLSRYWLVTQKQMDDHKADLIQLENGICQNLENLGLLKIQLRQSEYIVERMVELINQLDPKAYNSNKQQKLVDNLKEVANSSNKYQTLQDVNVDEQKNILSPLDEQNEQKSVEETNILNLEEHQNPLASNIENLHVEKIQMNQQSSENLESLKELNDKINSTEEHKHFEKFMKIAENMEKKIALLLEQNTRLDRIEENIERLNYYY